MICSPSGATPRPSLPLYHLFPNETVLVSWGFSLSSLAEFLVINLAVDSHGILEPDGGIENGFNYNF